MQLIVRQKYLDELIELYGTRNMDFGRVYENIVYLELRRSGFCG